MLAMPRRHQFCRQGVYQGWHGRSLRRPPGDRGPLGKDCTLDCPPSTLPHPRFLTSGCPLPVSLLRWSPFGEGVRFFSARSVLFPLSFRACLRLPSPHAPVPSLSLPCTCLLCVSSLHRTLLFSSGMGCDVSTLSQTLARHEGASGLVALASRGLARRRGPAFAADVDGRTSQSYWCHGVIRRRRPLLLHPSSPPRS